MHKPMGTRPGQSSVGAFSSQGPAHIEIEHTIAQGARASKRRTRREGATAVSD